MLKLKDLIDVIDIEFKSFPAIFIVNKPYNKEHILFCSLDRNAYILNRILATLGDAEVTYIALDAVVEDTRGSYAGTKIYISEANAIFDMGEPETYGDGFIDFGDIESGDYDMQQFNTYKDMMFYIPGEGLKIPR